MIFNTIAYYLLFLIPSVVLFRLASQTLKPWVIVLFGVGFFIYFSITAVGGTRGAFCVLMILWQALCCIYACRPKSVLCLLVGLQSLVFLCIFKYLNFFSLLIYNSAAHDPIYWYKAFLPLGISFFTFEFIHYAVDCYQGKLKGTTPADFLAFVLFYPTMVAGPIKRYQDFVPKLNNISDDWQTDTHRGVSRILVGLVKKFAIADILTAATNHLNVHDIALATGRIPLLLWIFGYGIKIYIDFSAYSDIAIGSARLYGIKVPENFDNPYLRRNIASFWQHWHISLYRWLIDYIFIPLGGSRVRPIWIYRNIMIVMLASGLWHGAGKGFIVWGLWHGIMLCTHRLWSMTGARYVRPDSALTAIASWALTYVMVNLGWAFFTMPFGTAIFFFHRLLIG